MVKVISSKEEFQALINGGKVVVVDFYADWCGPCKMIAPVFVELAGQNSDLEFVKVNVDELEDVAAECGISAMPTFQVYKGGKKVGELTGANKDKLLQLVQSNK